MTYMVPPLVLSPAMTENFFLDPTPIFIKESEDPSEAKLLEGFTKGHRLS